MKLSPTTLPAHYRPGGWSLDPAESKVAFTVRLFGIPVRGTISPLAGRIATAAEPADSTVVVTLDPATVNTRNARRDKHLRTATFLDLATHPSATYRSLELHADGDAWRIEGQLTLRGITKNVPLHLQAARFEPDGHSACFEATGVFDRTDFGITYLSAGGLLIGKRVTVHAHVSAVR